MTKRKTPPNLISIVCIVCTLLLSQFAVAQSERNFDTWLAELKQEAVAKGFSSESIELAFSEITAPVPRIINNDRVQPERVQTYDDYLGARVSEWKIRNGKELMTEHAELLREVEQQYGVQARYIVAFWGMETNFGTYPIPEPLFNALATLAFDNRRADFFRAQFMAALTMLDSGFPTYDKMKSSWAGAMGQSQFIPESYLAYAVDHDGDGKRDIWDTEADVFASIANYLKARGWRNDMTWGRKVTLPPGAEEAFRSDSAGGLRAPGRCSSYRGTGVWRDLQQWQALGVRQDNGADLPTRSVPAAIVYADSGDNEAYIVYENFCGIMAYNPAFKYALSIGLLSDLVVP